MKNFEKYEGELKAIGSNFAIIGNKLMHCDKVHDCIECKFYENVEGVRCETQRIDWLYEEYVEPPFKPKYHEEYWTYWYKSKSATRMFWDENTNDISNWKLGNCFRTREEAETKGKEIMEKIKKEYEEK